MRAPEFEQKLRLARGLDRRAELEPVKRRAEQSCGVLEREQRHGLVRGRLGAGSGTRGAVDGVGFAMVMPEHGPGWIRGLLEYALERDGDGAVQARASRERQIREDRLAHDLVREGEPIAIGFDGREQTERRDTIDLLQRRAAVDPRGTREPEERQLVPDHRGELDELARLRTEGLQARIDQVRKRPRCALFRVGAGLRAQQLAQEERTPAAAPVQRVELAGRRRLLRHQNREACDLLGRERRQLDPPLRARDALQVRRERRVRVGCELAVQADQEHTRRVRGVAELCREARSREVRPVQVVEYDRDRPLLGFAFERTREALQQQETRGLGIAPLARAVLERRGEFGQKPVELRARLGSRAQRLDHLEPGVKRTAGDPALAASPHEEHRGVARSQLAQKLGLPDAPVPAHEHRPAAPEPRLVELVAKHGELALAADEDGSRDRAHRRQVERLAENLEGAGHPVRRDGQVRHVGTPRPRTAGMECATPLLPTEASRRLTQRTPRIQPSILAVSSSRGVSTGVNSPASSPPRSAARIHAATDQASCWSDVRLPRAKLRLHSDG